MKFAGGFVVLVLAALSLGCVYLLWLGLCNVWRGIASTGWPTAQGVVSQVEMTRNTTRDKNNQTSTMYGAKLTIRFNAAGDVYTTDQVTWGQTLASGEAADATLIALRYPEGRKVTVHYNPSKPYEAVVRPGLTATAFLLPAAALAFLLFMVPAIPLSWEMVGNAGSSSMEAPRMTGLIRCVLVLPLMLGVGLLIPGIRNLRLGLASGSWPTVPGQWMKRPAEPDTQAETATNAPPPLPLRNIEYVYRYTVNGESYFNEIRWFGQGPASANGADAEIELNYPREQPLQVHYNPNDPETAVLSPGVRGFAWILPGAGIGFLIFGLAGLKVIGR